MRAAGLALAWVPAWLAACAAPAPSGPPQPPEHAAAMLAAIGSLAGDWDGLHDGQPVSTRFEPSSHGTAVRELLFVGTPEEMTNVYHLDGDSLLVTHYCALGNQPRLRARRLEAGRLEFTLDSVTNRASPDAPVMGALVLELVDPDHMVERWTASGKGTSEPGTEFRFTRRRTGTR